MTERAPTPDRQWWSAVARMDRELAKKGNSRLAENDSIGLLRVSTETVWEEGGAIYRHRADWMRSVVGLMHIGSNILAAEVYGDTQSSVGVRSVSFIPSGLLRYNPWSVKDHRYTLEGLEAASDANEPMEYEQRDGFRQAIAEDRQAQDHSGLSLPTEETYRFICDALRMGIQSVNR